MVKVEVVIEVVIKVKVDVGVRFRTVFLLARGSPSSELRKLDRSVGRGPLAEQVLIAGRKFGSAGGEVLFLTAPVLLVLMELKPL